MAAVRLIVVPLRAVQYQRDDRAAGAPICRIRRALPDEAGGKRALRAALRRFADKVAQRARRRRQRLQRRRRIEAIALGPETVRDEAFLQQAPRRPLAVQMHDAAGEECRAVGVVERAIGGEARRQSQLRQAFRRKQALTSVVTDDHPGIAQDRWRAEPDEPRKIARRTRRRRRVPRPNVVDRQLERIEAGDTDAGARHGDHLGAEKPERLRDGRNGGKITIFHPSGTPPRRDDKIPGREQAVSGCSLKRVRWRCNHVHARTGC